MSYIGRGTDKISNVEVLDNITFDGSSSYTLQKGGSNFTPSSANTLLLSIDGVVQAGNFTVSGSTIDFGTAVAGTSTCDFVLHYGVGLITTPADGTVSLAKLSATGTKDATTFLRGDNTFAAAGLDGWSSNSGNLLPADASKGIYLGTSSVNSAKLLDDYEEGTWTPVCRDASYSSGTIIGIYTPTASYTKIGRIVNLQFTIRRNDSQSLSDVLFVTGLPFTSSSSGMDANINGGVWVDNSSGDKMGFVNMGASVNHMAFRKSNTMDASIATDEWVNGRYIYGGATYIV